MRALIARAVSAAGHVVVAQAHDFSTAVAAALAEKPDAIVLDSRFPPSGALAAIPDLLAATAGAPIFVLAALGERDLVRAAVAAGARGVLLRPLRAQALREALGALEP